jgi:hypothetical protein
MSEAGCRTLLASETWSYTATACVAASRMGSGVVEELESMDEAAVVAAESVVHLGYSLYWAVLYSVVLAVTRVSFLDVEVEDLLYSNGL